MVAMKKHVESISNMQSVGYSPSQVLETSPIKSSVKDSMEDSQIKATDFVDNENYFDSMPSDIRDELTQNYYSVDVIIY